MPLEVDALRVIADFEYASRLTGDHWVALSKDAAWIELTAEMPELVNPVLERLGRLTMGQLQPGPELKIPGGNGPFQVIGKPIPRVQGFGVVSGRGRYTQHTVVPGLLFLRTPARTRMRASS
ncbi:MAG TPA: hypothetical protein VFA49_14930 [Chloroflexota bacterium]|jgi:hypothetical protein|nr:hypothetical protein [Chloroflexota bacterium]